MKGVNCVEYFTGGDEPKLLSGSDDFSAKVCILLPFFFFFQLCRKFNSYACTCVGNNFNLSIEKF